MEEAEPEIRRLARSSLTEIGQLLANTRALVQNLDKLVQKIDNNPAGFFFGATLPEYSPR